MGFMDKVAKVGADMVETRSRLIVSTLPKPDGKIHAAVVDLDKKDGGSCSSTGNRAMATNFINGVLSEMQDNGMDIVSVSQTKMDDSTSFLITYR